MGILADLQTHTLQARKSQSPMASFLGMTLSEVQLVAKNDGQREPTDADADKVIRAGIKSMTKAIAGDGKIPPLPVGEPYTVEMQAKLDLLSTYIPEPLDSETLRQAIHAAAGALGLPIEMRSMGQIMSALNESYPGRIDGVSVKGLISNGA